MNITLTTLIIAIITIALSILLPRLPKSVDKYREEHVAKKKDKRKMGRDVILDELRKSRR
ncbi:MAG: hypothetical protein NZ929_03765 [Aigarchaeota archaeon]|nr:hypothetical protein [Aigarchaeota archaeon]MCX8192801.1 hypothetical protein [Nitrososphaeria archaeon]MDW7986045.1 hypothetical protein [Nitrososphaerota archaeon]